MKKLLPAAFALLLVLAGCRGGKNEESQDPEGWIRIEPTELEMRPVDDFANRWMALAVGKGEDLNAMTIAWGSIGNLWGKPIMIVYVSKDRFSKNLMDSNDSFTVTRFPEERRYKDALVYLGSHSKRDDPDKVAASGLTVELTESGNAIFAEGDLAIECRKLYSDEFKADLLPESLREGLYEEMGMHSFYIGEITGVWQKGSTPEEAQ